MSTTNTPFEDGLDKILSNLVLHTKIPLSSESVSGFKERQKFNELRVTEAKAALAKLHKAAIVAELEAMREKQATLCSIAGVMYLGDRIAAIRREK